MAVNRPSKIGKYDIIEVIGRGGMGIVYKGRDPHLDRLVAIKMMTGSFSDNPDLLKRFYREAQSTASLQHRNIVTVYELGDQAGSPYLVMEYLDGESLDSMLSDRRPQTLTEKLGLVLEICHGLSYAHERGVVHRDIKPANIMVSKGGGVKIVDFGIAHFGDINVTLTGQIVGSISYMSPEQVNGRTVDARTDIFSTGIVLYQLLTSALPFDGDNAASTLLKIVNEPPPPLTHFLSDYPRELDQVIHRALAKDRTERYPSAEELALDLGQVQAQLKQNLIAGYFQQARQQIERQDLYGAKQQLVEILKIDYQNTDASLLLRELQEKIQAQEIGKEVEQLRWQAEEAFAQERFESALSYIERALDLDKKNVQLLALRDRVKAAAFKVEKLNRAMAVAESAHQAGDLDSAKHAVDEALELAPNDTHVKALHRAVHTDWAERERRREIEGYVEQARRQISSRKFTAALELLKQAEALAPQAPEIQALIESARAAQEQERRRRELEAINRGIEDAINRDDYESATIKADEGLKLFPGERSLLKLKALAEKQRQAAKRKQFVEQQLADARSLMEQGHGEEVVGHLEAALAQIGDEPRLHSLLLIVRENLRREQLERRRAEYLQAAKEALRQKQHEQAISILEKARVELDEAGEVEDLLQFAKEEAASEERRRRADAAADQAHRLMADEEYESAIRLLEESLETEPDEELRIILGEARRAALVYEKKREMALSAAGKLIEARRPAEALQLLEAQPPSFWKRAEFGQLREKARSEAERLRHIGDALEAAREHAASEDYREAVRILRLCRETHGSTAELDNELAQALDKQLEAATRIVERALNDARILLHAAEYQAAINRLQTPSEQGDIPSSLKPEWEKARQQAVNGLAQQSKAEIERQLAAGEITAAAELLERTLTQLPGHRELFELETIVQQESARKADAETKLAEAQALFQNSAWKPGAELLRRAFLSANRLPKVRQAVVETLVEGAQTAAESDWRQAESLLVEAQELEPNFPGAAPISARIQARRRQEAASECLEKAQRARQAGELRAAQSELAQGLSAFPDQPQLEQLKQLVEAEIREQEAKQQREREQKEKAAFFLELGGRLDEETRLERRLAILKHALEKYPGDRALEGQFAELEALKQQVSALVKQAEKAEESKQYLEAIAHWESLSKLYPRYPGLETHLATVRGLHQEAQAAQKANWVQKVGQAVAAGELEEAARALFEALEEFPEDRQFTALKRQIEEARKLRTKAEKSIQEAGKAFAQSRWKKGVESLCRGYETAPHDPLIRRTLVDRLSEAFQSALKVDSKSASELVASAARLLPASSILPSFEKRVDERKRQELLEDCLKQARTAQNQGNWQKSLRHVEAGLAQYPSQKELLALKAEIESHARGLEAERSRQHELEKRQQLERARQEEERRRRASQARAQQLGETRVIEEPSRREPRAYEQETQVNQLQAEKWPSAETIELPARSTLRAGRRPTMAPAPVPEPTRTDQDRPLVEIGQATPARRVPVVKISAALAAVLLIALAFKFWPHSRPIRSMSVAIATDPAGASVRIGDHLCRTPGCQIELPPGNYQVSARLDGYQPFAGNLKVEADKNKQPVVFVLQPLPPPAAKSSSPGTLTVRAGIAGALVFIDEVAHGRTGQDGVLTLQLEPKSYRVRVEKPNYQSPRERRVDIAKGASRDLAFELVPVRAETSQSAELELRGAPRDVEVRLAGTLLGRTDGASSFRKSVLSGEQILEVTSGSTTRQIKENLVAGQTLSLEWASVAPAEPTKPEPSAAMIEDQEWQRVRASNQPTDIEAFLKKYPGSTHVPDAQLLLEELAWAETNHNDLASLENYLARFPAGRNRGEASTRIDDIQWSQVDKKDRAALVTFLGGQPNSMHRQDAQRALEQIATQESIKQVLLKPLDLFNAAFERQRPHELKEVWPSASERYLDALRPRAGYRFVLRLQANAEPVVSGSTAQVLCDLFSDTTEPGGQNKQNKKRVRVSLYKDGDRWLIRDPFGQE